MASVSSTFYCQTCLENRPNLETSPDPRYCLGCYDFLKQEWELREDTRRGKPDWVPLISDRLVQDVTICPGDRVQFVGETDCLRKVTEVRNLAVVCGGTIIDVKDIGEHQINGREDNIMTTPQENLRKCRETLARVEANNADPRVIGLWKAKVAQAEHLCSDVVAESGKAERLVSADSKPEKSKPPKVEKKTAVTAVGVRPCLCGCGGPASAGRNFLPGHDARFASYIRKLDAGKLTREQLPASVQGLLNHDDDDVVLRAREHNKPRN